MSYGEFITFDINDPVKAAGSKNVSGQSEKVLMSSEEHFQFS